MSAIQVVTLSRDELESLLEEAAARGAARVAPSPAPQAKGYLTIKGAAKELDCSTDTIYRWIDSGRLRASRVGGGRGAWRIARVDLEAALDDQPAPEVDPREAAVLMLRRRR